MSRWFLLVLAPFTVAYATAGPSDPDRPASGPPGVVLVIADGAGAAHWSAARLFSDSMAVSGLPVIGLVESSNTSRPEPESASSATALATGVRTHYNGVGVGPDSLPRRSVVEAARALGFAAGLVTTTHLVDATPAAFAAHVPVRADREEIARQIAGSGIEVLLGDGRRWFSASERADSRDLVADMAAGYAMVPGGADPLERARDPAVVRLAGFFDMDSIADPAVRTPSLARMTAAALEVLGRDPEGFFLVVENEHTDHASHRAVPLERIAAEMLEVDRAIGEILAFRASRPETLVVVLGDHETGGLSIRWDEAAGAWAAGWAAHNHTPVLVPLFAVGPGAERFAGVRTSDEVGRILLELVTGAGGAPVTGD